MSGMMGQLRSPPTGTLPPVGGKHFAMRYDAGLRAETLVASGVPEGRLVTSDSTAALAFLPGVGTEKSTLASVVGPAERFQTVREVNGHKRTDHRSQPVRVGTSAVAWPYHGGPVEPAMADLDTLMTWLGGYVGALGATDLPRIGIGRSFGGTALLEYVLGRDGEFREVVAVSPYTPAWTGFVLQSLSRMGRDFNLPGWQWILQLDGMIARGDRTPMTSERLAALTAEYGGMAVIDYWQRVRSQSQWTFPELLSARLDRLRAQDSTVDEFWNCDWRMLSQSARNDLFARARAAREAAGFPALATGVTILFGEQDPQYPATVFPVAFPEMGVRAYWQAFAVAFGVRLMGVPGGHDVLGGPNPNRAAVDAVYGLIREVVDATAQTPRRPSPGPAGAGC